MVQRLSLFSFIVFSFVFSVSSATISWIASSGGNWSTAANWDSARVPGGADDVVFNGQSGTAQGSCTFDVSSASVHNITFTAGYTGLFDFSSHTLSLTGNTADFRSGGSFTATGLIDFANGGTINFYPAAGTKLPRFQSIGGGGAAARTISLQGSLTAGPFYAYAGTLALGSGFTHTIDSVQWGSTYAIDFGSSTLQITGNFWSDENNISIIKNTGTLAFTGATGTQHFEAVAFQNYPAITHTGASTLQISSTYNLSCVSFVQSAGSLDLGGRNITTVGNFTVNNGTSSTFVSGSLDNRKITVRGTASLSGQSGNLLDLNAASPCTLAVTGTLSANFVNISNNKATLSAGNTANSIDGGNNQNWNFGGGSALASWDFNGEGMHITSSTADLVAANVSTAGPSTVASWGSGVTANNQGVFPNALAATGFNSTTLATAVSNNKYLTFTVTAASGYLLNISNVMFYPCAQNNQSLTWALLSSVDNFTNAIGTYSNTGSCSTCPQQTMSVTGHSNLSTVEFRIYIYGAAGNNFESYGINNAAGYDLIVTGTTALSLTTMPGPLTYSQNTVIDSVGMASTANTCANAAGTAGAADSFVISPVLPAGLILNKGNGTISGTPTVSATQQTFTVTATNLFGSSSTTVTITVILRMPGPLAYSQNPATYTVGATLTTNTCTNTGGTADSFTISPPIPGGLLFNKQNGSITGIPSVPAPLGAYTVSAYNQTGVATTILSITVNPAAPGPLKYSDTAVVYTKGKPITPNTCVNPGGAPDSFTVSPALPAGLLLDRKTGAITGTPTQNAPKQTYQVTAQNVTSAVSVGIAMTVIPARPGPISYLQNPAQYLKGFAVAQNTVANAGGDADSFTIDTQLPDGLTFNKTTGAVSGVPTVASPVQVYTVTAFNAAGSATVMLQLGVTEPGDMYNPLIVRTSRVDSTQVRLSIVNYTQIPSTNLLVKPWVDTVGVWYGSAGFPSTPAAGDPHLIKIPIAGMKTSPEPYLTIVNVPPLASKTDSIYYFAISLFWRRLSAADSIPAFTRANGDSVLMKDTAALKNACTISGNYAGDRSDSAAISIGNVGSLDTSIVSDVEVQCALSPAFTSPLIDDVVFPAAVVKANANSGQYTFEVRSARFNGPTDTIYCSVVLIGKNKRQSSAAVGSFVIGRELAPNPVVLNAQPVSASKIFLTWQKISESVKVDSLRISYDVSVIPPGAHDPVPDKTFYPVVTDTKFLVSGLNAQKEYFFAAQAYIDGLWTDVTLASSAAATTLEINDSNTVINTIIVDTVWYDSAQNQFTAAFKCPLLSGVNLEYGVTKRSKNTALASAGDVYGTSLTKSADTISIPCGENILFDTAYVISFWLRQVDGPWAMPTPQSEYQVRTPSFKWQPIAYFKYDTSTVTAYNGQVVLWPQAGKTWNGGVVEDTIDKYNIPDTLAGFIPVSVGFAFRVKAQSQAFNIGLTYNTIPPGHFAAEVRMYRRNPAGQWLVFDSVGVDSSKGNRLVWVTTDSIDYPFMLLIDTLKPVVTRLGPDTSDIVPADSAVRDSLTVSDNIANVKIWYRYARGDEQLPPSDPDTLRGTSATFTKTIPADAVNDVAGVRAFCIVSDGVHHDTLNLSRRVRRTHSFDVATDAGSWVPLRVTAELSKKDVDTALTQLLSSGEPWRYDMTKFRVFRWWNAPFNSADTGKWVEYSEQNRQGFSLEPGKLMWLKTVKTQPLDFGPGVTTSLKDTFVIELPSRAWTDFALPFRFSMYIGDILAATGPNADSLQFYHWRKNGKQYFTEGLYFPLIPKPELNNLQALMSSDEGDGAFTVYNFLSAPVTLRIPPVPYVMSPVQNPVTKRKAASSWVLTVQSSTAGGTVHSPVLLGYTPGLGKSFFSPVAPSFGQTGVCVYDRRNNRVYGNEIKHLTGEGGGFLFELQFTNRSDHAENFIYTISGVNNLPDGTKAVVVDPVAMTVAPSGSGTQAVVGARGTGYRLIGIGSGGYCDGLLARLGVLNFSVQNVFPNPFKKGVTVRFSVPYCGLGKVECSFYDSHGKLVYRQSTKGPLRQGAGSITWNGEKRTNGRTAAGLYLLTVAAFDNTGNQVKRHSQMVLYLP